MLLKTFLLVVKGAIRVQLTILLIALDLFVAMLFNKNFFTKVAAIPKIDSQKSHYCHLNFRHQISIDELSLS